MEAKQFKIQINKSLDIYQLLNSFCRFRNKFKLKFKNDNNLNEDQIVQESNSNSPKVTLRKQNEFEEQVTRIKDKFKKLDNLLSDNSTLTIPSIPSKKSSKENLINLKMNVHDPKLMTIVEEQSPVKSLLQYEGTPVNKLQLINVLAKQKDDINMLEQRILYLLENFEEHKINLNQGLIALNTALNNRLKSHNVNVINNIKK